MIPSPASATPVPAKTRCTSDGARHGGDAHDGHSPLHFDHPYPFDPSHGYSWERLLAIQPPEAPAGFEEFWSSTRKEWRQQGCGWVEERWSSPDRLEGYRVERIRFTSWDKWEIEAWLALPVDEPVTRGVVVGHGYEGRTTPQLEFHIPGAAMIFPCFRGLALSRREGVSAMPQRHVLTGIDSASTSILRGCATDIWSATTALVRCAPEAEARLDYVGCSLAGGLGMLAMPWEDRFTAAHINIPTFGHHRLRLGLQCTGSGHALTRYAQQHPEIFELSLPFLDPAISATLEKRPVHYAVAEFDPVVPPPGQAAIYNAHAGPKELFRRSLGHFHHAVATAELERMNRELEAFFTH